MIGWTENTGEWLIPTELVKTGVEGLDALLNGGVVRGSTVLISGNYGSGKTLLSLQYAFHQARKGENILYVSTSEPVFKIRQFSGNLSFYDEALVRAGYRDFADLRAGNGSGFVEFVESSMGVLAGASFSDVGTFMEQVRDMVGRQYIQHLIIDPITSIAMMYDSEAVMRKDTLLMGAWLTRLGCTVLMTAEESDPKLLEVEKYLADCVIRLNTQVVDRKREFCVSVEKLRGNLQHMRSQSYLPGPDGIMIRYDLAGLEREHVPT